MPLFKRTQNMASRYLCNLQDIRNKTILIARTATDSVVPTNGGGKSEIYVFTPTAGNAISVKAGDIFGWFVHCLFFQSK